MVDFDYMIILHMWLVAGTKRKRGSARTHLGPHIDRSQDKDDGHLDEADGGAAAHKDDALNT
jgi:hypothetical protein